MIEKENKYIHLNYILGKDDKPVLCEDVVE